MKSTPFHIVRASDRNGSVLIVVLCVCLGLVSVTLLFGHSMLMAYRGADNDLSGRQADQAIDGAARYVETLLLNAETPGLLPDIITYESDAVAVGEATFWFMGRADDNTKGTTRAFGLVDEASKINLNMAAANPQILVDILQKLPGMTAEFAAAIIDWRDTDDDVFPDPAGAESETYNRQTPPSTAKNADFESVEELAMVSGSNRLILLGEDTNLNGVLDPNEDDGEASLPSDNSDGKLDPGIFEYVTVFSKEPNKQSDGTARVSVAQPGEELRTLLTTKLSSSRATEILANIGPGVRFTSVLAFYLRSGMKADEFDLVSDALTVSTEENLIGLINVNTASETVLACLPGIDADKASALVTARLARATHDTSMAWAADILGQAGVQQAGPYLTGRTYQISADVAAVGRHGRGYRRARFVIDNSTGTPKIIYRRNLASLGWALGSDVRDSFASTKRLQ